MADVNRTLRGWFVYFQHSTDRRLLYDIDGWLRVRLRSILRKRRGGRGRGRGADHQRWPNAFFAELGLFSLKTAHGLGRSILSEVTPSTGEPDAGNPPVRFGGKGGRGTGLPYPDQASDAQQRV